MPVTKITLSTAMRARDVSRPREEQLAEAAEREEAAGRHADEPTPGRTPRHQAPPEPARRDPVPRQQPPAVQQPTVQPPAVHQPGPAEQAPTARRRRRRSR